MSFTESDLQFCQLEAQRHGRRLRRDWRELLSAVWEGHEKARCRFRNDMGCSWKTYAKNMILWTLIDVLRSEQPSGCRTRSDGKLVKRYVRTQSLDAVHDDDDKSLAISLVSPLTPSEFEMTIRDEINAITQNMRDRLIIRMLVEGYSLADCSRHLGVSSSLISQRLKLIRRAAAENKGR